MPKKKSDENKDINENDGLGKENKKSRNTENSNEPSKEDKKTSRSASTNSTTMTDTKTPEDIVTETTAKAAGKSLPISSKHTLEICKMLRAKKVQKAKEMLEEVIKLKKAVPFKQFNRNVGHKTRIGPGRYPQKAAKHVLKVLESAEANALFKGLDSQSLTIKKIIANRASRPMRYGRIRRGKSKRTHLEIIVSEAPETFPES